VNRIRKCIFFGSLKKRSELIKITKERTSGNVILMPDSKTFGRSVYLCYNQSCIDNAFKKNRINKTLKTGADINKSDVYDLLAKDLKGTTDEQFKS
jgi:predicted RNA-binding protein YlxR (DUF448 family)